MSLLKHFGEQNQDIHGGTLSWPGLHGLPVRGQRGMLRDEELDSKFEVARDFHHREFDLSNAEDAKAYTDVMDRIVAGWYSRLFFENYRDTETKKRFVYLEWIQNYGQLDTRPRLESLVNNGGSSIKRVG